MFKVHDMMIYTHMHCEMITIIKLINISSYTVTILCVCVIRAHEIYSANFQYSAQFLSFVVQQGRLKKWLTQERLRCPLIFHPQ